MCPDLTTKVGWTEIQRVCIRCNEERIVDEEWTGLMKYLCAWEDELDEEKKMVVFELIEEMIE